MKISTFTSMVACCLAILSSPVAGQSTDSNAVMQTRIEMPSENIRNLNIMLMVTSLRCRGGAHDFSVEYDRFATTHGENIAIAHRQLEGRMAADYGNRGIKRRMDRESVRIANRFGQGHPRLNCAQLKEATAQLAMSQDSIRLTTMANRLLDTTAAGSSSSFARSTEATAITYDRSISLAEGPAWLRE